MSKLEISKKLINLLETTKIRQGWRMKTAKSLRLMVVSIKAQRVIPVQ